MALHHWLGSFSVTTDYSCVVGDEMQSMRTEKLALETPDGASTQADFDVSARVAFRLWRFNKAAISFAGSSVSTRASFVQWVKDELRESNMPSVGDGGDGGGGGGGGGSSTASRREIHLSLSNALHR